MYAEKKTELYFMSLMPGARSIVITDRVPGDLAEKADRGR
jgi:hypothetical protein